MYCIVVITNISWLIDFQINDLKDARRLASEITEKGAQLYDMLAKEVDLRVRLQVFTVISVKHLFYLFVELILVVPFWYHDSVRFLYHGIGCVLCVCACFLFFHIYVYIYYIYIYIYIYIYTGLAFSILKVLLLCCSLMIIFIEIKLC